MSTSAKAPTVVYSCVVKNNSDAEVTVKIDYIGIEDHHKETLDVELAKGEEQEVDEKTFFHGESSTGHHKTVERIHVRKFDGKIMELKAPFDGVTSPRKKWIFEIENNSIKSVDPNKKR